MLHSSYITLNKEAYQNNIRLLTDFAGPEVTFSAVIKGNAYGHGIEYLVPMAEECGVRHFSVFSADEALKAFNAQESGSTIMIMGMIDNDQMDWAVEHGIECYIFENDRLLQAAQSARKIGQKARIHLQIETGMNRTGLERRDLGETVKILREQSNLLDLAGLCTHFAGAESVGNYLRIQQQIKSFKAVSRWFKIKGFTFEKYHTACSAALLNYPETKMDMVRVGIAHYGFWPNRETYMNVLKKNRSFKDIEDPLQRVISWKSKVMSIKKVEAGEYIGYGSTYLANRDMTIATVPIGYTHGFKRDLTNKGIVLVKGERAQVVGLVNMNMITIDISDINGVQKGDEVIIIGEQGEQTITVASFSDLSENMNYEVLTRLPGDLPRSVIGNDR